MNEVCSRCGFTINEPDRYCPHCGKALVPGRLSQLASRLDRRALRAIVLACACCLVVSQSVRVVERSLTPLPFVMLGLLVSVGGIAIGWALSSPALKGRIAVATLALLALVIVVRLSSTSDRLYAYWVGGTGAQTVTTPLLGLEFRNVRAATLSDASKQMIALAEQMKATGFGLFDARRNENLWTVAFRVRPADGFSRGRIIGLMPLWFVGLALIGYFRDRKKQVPALSIRPA